MPKLKPRYIEPVIMMNVSNGRSACLMRVESPIALAETFERLADILRSDLWLDVWQRLEYCSNSIKIGEQATIDLDSKIYDDHD